MSRADFDYEKLLSLLPRHKLLKPVDLKNANLPKWPWPPLKNYNGFTSNERIHTWKVGTYLLNIGAIAKPKTCDICKHKKPIGFHSENYYNILNDPFLCKSCHSILHLRFRHPHSWYRLLDTVHPDKETWFSILIVEKIDLARFLRNTLNKKAMNRKFGTRPRL